MSGMRDRQSPPTSAVREEALVTLLAAYGDGQITLAEYEERVAGVHAADNAWRLERCIDDLRGPPPPPPSWRARALGPLRAWWDRTSRGTKVAVGAAAAALVCGLGAAVVLEQTRSDDVVVAVGEERHSSGLEKFRAAYARQFGATDIGWVQIDDDYATFEQPVEADLPRFQRWRWEDGSFRRVGSVHGGSPGTLDLAEIDVAAVDHVVRTSVETLQVEDVSSVTTVLSPQPDGAERITLILRNDYMEQARVTTDFSGRVLTQTPFGEREEG